MGIIMTYAVNDRNSFSNIENWMKQIQENAAENASVMLVANKVVYNYERAT
jgi:Ras-related protein Rab-8A